MGRYLGAGFSVRPRCSAGRAHHQMVSARARWSRRPCPQSGASLELDVDRFNRARWSRDARRRAAKAGRRGCLTTGDRARDRQAARRDARRAGASVGRSGFAPETAGTGRRSWASAVVLLERAFGLLKQADGTARRSRRRRSACCRSRSADARADDGERRGRDRHDPRPRRLPPRQVLVASGDVYLIDSEGARRALAERRAKASPLRDVGADALARYAAAATSIRKVDAARLPAEQRGSSSPCATTRSAFSTPIRRERHAAEGTSCPSS